MKHIYYHVSSHFEAENTIVVLKEGEKPLQCYVDYFKNLDCSTYNTFIDNYNAAFQKYADIENKTCRRFSKWVTEALFESVRKIKYKDLPSRMDGVFVWNELEKAKRFNALNRDGKASVYACEIEKVHSFNMSIFTDVECVLNECLRRNTITEDDYSKWIDIITTYWDNDHYIGDDAEYIYQGTVYLTKCMMK